jgi:hypothetical protein
MTIAIPKELHTKMRGHSEIRWSEVARNAFESKVAQMDAVEAIAKKSKLTQKDVDEISALIKRDTWKDIKNNALSS